MCSKVLSYLISSKYFHFLKKVSTFQQVVFVILGFSFVVFLVNKFEYFYYLTGLNKIILLLVIVFFLVGTFLHILKIFIDKKGYLDIKPIATSYCLQLVGIIIGLLYLLYKIVAIVSMGNW